MSSDEHKKQRFIPYSRPVLSDDDLQAVADVLGSTTISQGQRLADFETAFAGFVGTKHAHAFSSGTAALHAMCDAAGLAPGDEVIIPALTFAGTANAVRYVGAVPVFADVDPVTNCLDPVHAERLVTTRTKAILAVDFAGHPCDYAVLRSIATRCGIVLLSDSAHAAGAKVGNVRVGSLADMTAFSFNPVKNMTAAEGGMVTTSSGDYSRRLNMFGSHGMTRETGLLEGTAPAPWYYEQQFLGYNYKLSELHAALGLSQLRQLEKNNRIRAKLASYYARMLQGLPLVLPRQVGNILHAWHLCIVRLRDGSSQDRDLLFTHLREAGFGVQLHYIPVPLHPDYRRLGYTIDGLVNTMAYFRTAISLPLNPAMNEEDCQNVSNAVRAFFADRGLSGSGDSVSTL